MNHFEYRDDVLCAEDVRLDDIAQQVGTPFYCYSTATLVHHWQVLADALAKAGLKATVCYALKANANRAVVQTLARCGAGADVVSEGELRQALTSGVPAEKIVFSGVGKTREELLYAVSKGILQINVESEPELEMLSAVASERGVRARVALRVNPDVDAGTHAKITTGTKENKFGIAWDDAARIYARAATLPGLDVMGLACHIGSQLSDMTPFRNAFRRIHELVLALRAAGHTVTTLDVGGGLGVPYGQEIPPSPMVYAGIIAETLSDLGCRLILEPGRLMVGNAGVLVTQVIRIKDSGHRRFVIVDAAMNDLMRPALYDAHHTIMPVQRPEAGTPQTPADVVGPVCETGDTFARDRILPPVQAGDLLVLCTAGAYGATMSSSYNCRPLIPEVLVKGGEFAVVRSRPSYSKMHENERLPAWLEDNKP